MSFWLSYVGIGFAGTRDPVLRRLPHAAVLGPGGGRHAAAAGARAGRVRVDPPLALRAVLPGAGAAWRCWSWGPASPTGTPLRHGLHFTYNHVAAVQFLRASYKAAPLLAVALACLAGAAAPRAVAPCSGRALGPPGGGRRRRWPAPRCWRWRPGRWSPAAPRTRRCPSSGFRPPGARRRADLDRELPRQLAGDRAARRPVLVLHLGRHRRSDPAGAQPAAGGRALRGPLRRPARHRPAVDDRRPRPPAAAAPRPAGAAAVADRGAVGDHRHRRRSGPQRRARPRRRRRGAGGPARLRHARPRLRAGRAASRPPAWGPRCACREVRRYDLPAARGLVRVEPRASADRGRRLGRRGGRAGRVRRPARRPRAAVRGRPDSGAAARRAAPAGVSW